MEADRIRIPGKHHADVVTVHILDIVLFQDPNSLLRFFHDKITVGNAVLNLHDGNLPVFCLAGKLDRLFK